MQKEKASNQETISSLIEVNEGLNQRLSEINSRLKKYKKRLHDTLPQKTLIEAELRKIKKTYDTKINRLGLKLRIVTLNRKKTTCTNLRNGKEVPDQPSPADVIRDLEHQLYVKTKEWTDMKNIMKNTLLENTRYEREIETNEEKMEIIRHQLMNTRAAIREG